MRHSNEMLLWGQRDGEMHFIGDVENGLACICICPHCSQPLIARNNGEIRTHSFAHFSGAECSKAIESAVHKLAKQVLAETKKLLLPPCFGNGPSGIKEYISKTFIDLESVELEKSIFVDNVWIRPDAVAKFQENELYIEFRFTHSVDDHKTNIIRQKNGCGIKCMIEVKEKRAAARQDSFVNCEVKQDRNLSPLPGSKGSAQRQKEKRQSKSLVQAMRQAVSGSLYLQRKCA